MPAEAVGIGGSVDLSGRRSGRKHKAELERPSWFFRSIPAESPNLRAHRYTTRRPQRQNKARNGFAELRGRAKPCFPSLPRVLSMSYVSKVAATSPGWSRPSSDTLALRKAPTPPAPSSATNRLTPCCSNSTWAASSSRRALRDREAMGSTPYRTSQPAGGGGKGPPDSGKRSAAQTMSQRRIWFNP